jgi:3-dehydroquinate dehydratase-2
MAKLLLLNGPNLNLLGSREPDVYGSDTLQIITSRLRHQAKQLKHTLETFQSNAEHELVERIHKAGRDGIEFIVFNPGAYTHTSIALRDALLGVDIPFLEVHISNIFAREPFRHHSYLSDIARGVISGLGAKGYELALETIDSWLTHRGN